MSSLNSLPSQQKTSSQKDKQWKEQCVDAIIEMASNHDSSSKRARKSFRDLYDGVINDSNYEDVLKPFGKDRENMPNITNYNIVKPLVDILTGEKQKRPISDSVTSSNDDVVSKYREKLFEKFKQAIYKEFMRELKQQGSGKEIDYEEFAEEFSKSYSDERTIRGQHSLNYLRYSKNLNYKLKKAFKGFLIDGIITVVVELIDDELFIDFPDNLQISFDPDQEIEFIEDGSWAMRRRSTTHTHILRRYGSALQDKYGKKVIAEIESSNGENAEGTLMVSDVDNGTGKNEGPQNIFPEIEYFNVWWVSQKKVGIVEGIDPTTGQFYINDVEDGYKPAEYEEVEWYWDEEVWRGTRIDNSYYVNVEPVPVQRSMLSRNGGNKLPINGRVYSDYYKRPISLVSIVKPYQYLFNVYMYRLERAIAKSRDTIAVFDINFLPSKFESFDEFFYWMDKTGIAFVDYNKENYRGSPTHQSYIDLTAKSIGSYIELLRFILEAVERLTGINPQRQGQVGAYEGKGTTERAVIQSSHITEDYFFKFGQFEQVFFQSLLDYSKAAWLDGKKLHYHSDGNKAEFYEIDGIQHLESEYNVFVTNDIRDLDDLEQMRGLAQAMVQNGAPMSAVAETIRSRNFAELKNKIQDMEKAQAQRSQQMREMEEQIEKEKADLEKENMQHERNIKQMEIDGKLQEAQMKQTLPEDDSFDKKKHEDDIRLKERELSEKERSNKADEAIKRKQANKQN